MNQDINYMKGKILAEEKKRLYFSIVSILGLNVFLVIRDFLTSEEFVSYFFLIISILFLIFKYLKFYNLKNKFLNKELGNGKLKSYMKMDKIPSIEDVDGKFNERKSKRNRRFYLLGLRILIINIAVFCINYFLTPQEWWFYIISVFGIVLLLYRYLLVFRVSKYLLNEKWMEKQINFYITFLRFK
jgi:hypothetical protein